MKTLIQNIKPTAIVSITAITTLTVLAIVCYKGVKDKFTIEENVETHITISKTTSRSLDEHMVAEVTTNLPFRRELKRGISTGYFDTFIAASFMYYISWDNFNLTIRDNNCYLTFQKPILHVPVTYNTIRYETTSGLIVTKNELNEMYSKFSQNELPTLLSKEGNSYDIRFIAEARAKESIEDIFRRRILPMFKIDVNKIQNVIVKFDNVNTNTVEKIKLTGILPE